MPGRTIELPKSGFALEIDGRLKTEFSTREGAERGAIELKRRFPMLQIRIYDADTQTRQDFPDLALTGRKARVYAGSHEGLRDPPVTERQHPPASHVRLAPPPRH